MWGRQGTLKLAVDNEADYPLEVEAQLTGDGIFVLDESDFIIELQPGRNEVLLQVETARDPYLLEIRLLAGSTLLDEDDLSVRPLTIMTFLPWVLAAVVVIGVVVFAFLWLRRRRSRA